MPPRARRLRSSLWATVACCYPAFVVYAVGTVVLPISARDSVIDEILEWLDFALPDQVLE